MIGDPRGPLEEPKGIASVRRHYANRNRQTWRWRTGDPGCNLGLCRKIEENKEGTKELKSE